MKVFERLLKKHICSSIPATLDPLQFAYRPNRSTDDAIPRYCTPPSLTSTAKMATMSGCYSSTIAQAFNTIVPTKLAVKLSDLGLNTSLCDWIQDFLTDRPQVVKVGSSPPTPITPEHRSPTGCVLSPLLYSSIHPRLRVLTSAHFHC